MRLLSHNTKYLWLCAALWNGPALFAQSDLPNDKLDETKAQPAVQAPMVAPPSCFLWAEPSDTRTPETSISLKMETAGKVTTAVLDTADVDTKGGEKKITPYQPVMTPSKTGPVPVDEKASTYLASVAGPGGTAVCLIWVSRTETLPKPPRCSIEPAEQTVKAGDPSSITLKVDGELKDLVINEKPEDNTKRSFTFTLATSRAITISVGGPGGLTTCSALITIAPKA